MSDEPYLRSNVPCLPQEQFDKLKGQYLYISHRLLKSLDMLKNKRTGRTRGRGTAFPETVLWSSEECERLEELLADLEHRLRQVFVIPDNQQAGIAKRNSKKEA